MRKGLKLPRPRCVPPLDEGFRPAALANHAFLDEVNASRAGVPLVFALERHDGAVSRYETRVFPDDRVCADGHERAGADLMYAERLLKFLLWQRGGWRVHVGGPRSLGDALARIYSPDGERRFDCHFLGESVYDRAFELVACDADDVPPAREIVPPEREIVPPERETVPPERETVPPEREIVPPEREVARPLGRHLDGCRIGFDLGASDRKVAAVVDGTPVFSEEVVWEPRTQRDPAYHYREIMAGLRRAAAHMPRVDAIGGSSAGIYIDNRVKIASIFRGVPKARFGEVRDLFLRISDELGVPFEIVNDGDVAALAGSMSLGANAVLGIALGSSQAGGYVTPEGNITGWLNELAFAPIDYSPHAPVEEWSGDRGCGAQYLSQQCVFRLAPKAGIDVPRDAADAEKLRFVQDKLESGHDGARKIWQSMGTYMGYALAHYASFYEPEHVLILGRCTSGQGGHVIIQGAQAVLEGEFPQLAEQIALHLPDEKGRRMGQSIAAASLPAITEKVS